MVNDILIRATTEAELSELNDLVHDLWLHTDSICFEQQEMRIPLGSGIPRKKWFFKYETPAKVYPWTLTVASAVSYAIDDRAGVGSNTITDITFEGSEGQVLLKCGPDCDIVIVVQQLDVALLGERRPGA
jgi:hypothetical protein